MSSHSFHHPQEVLLAQFSLYVHKGGLKPHSFHVYSQRRQNLKSALEIGLGVTLLLPHHAFSDYKYAYIGIHP